MSAIPQFDSSLAETSLSAVLDALTDAACLVDAGSRIFFFNEPFAEFWRDVFGAEPHLGMNVSSDSIGFWADLVAGARRADGSHVVRGVRRYFSGTSTSIREGTAIIVRDVTQARERERLVHTIQRKGAEWALTFDAIESPIFLTSAAGIVVRMNRAARDLAGGTYQSILDRRIGTLGEGEVWRALDDVVHAIVESRQSCSARAMDQEKHWDIGGSVYAAEGEERVILILRDITRLVTLQESVRRGEQLAAMGELVAGVAHEVRNPLFGMGVTLDVYEPLVNHDADSAEMFTSLRTWIQRLNQLMEDLLQYGKSWRVDLREGHLGDVIEQAVAQSLPLADQMQVHICAESERELTMLMDPSRLAHAVQNLILNAVQHSGAESHVFVNARRENGMIECTVRDTGPGFDAKDLPRIFQPFFTRRRGGTGLGLSIVQRIVDEHGGTVLAENAAGGGGVVRMRFPVFSSTDKAGE